MRPRNLILSLSALGLLAVVARPMAAQEHCTERPLASGPQWISSLELISDREILIADPKASQLISFDTASGRMQKVKLPESLSPASVTRIEGGYLIKYRDDATIIGPDKKVIKTLNLRSTKTGEVSGLGSLYSNWITRSTTFVGFGSISSVNLGTAEYNPSRGFELGLITGEVSAGSGQFRNIQLLEQTEQNDFYLLGFPYFAATDDGLFYVRMTGAPGTRSAAIMRVEKTPSGKSVAKNLAAFPDDFRTIPNLASNKPGPPKAQDRFKRVQESRMPVGLFGLGKMLYLLVRQPASNGEGTEWFVYKINPAEDVVLDWVRLPTRAPHLSVAAGPAFWYLIERGEVRGLGDQDITKVIAVPTRWITSPAALSPLNPDSSRNVPCKTLPSATLK